MVNMHDHTIIDTIPLPEGIAGLTDGTTIWLNPALTEAGRRCTLAHELAHIERGIHPGLPEHLTQVEEARVDKLAARRLVTHPELLDTVLWVQDNATIQALAHELFLDHEMTRVRLATVTKEERDEINTALDHSETDNEKPPPPKNTRPKDPIEQPPTLHHPTGEPSKPHAKSTPNISPNIYGDDDMPQDAIIDNSKEVGGTPDDFDI